LWWRAGDEGKVQVFAGSKSIAQVDVYVTWLSVVGRGSLACECGETRAFRMERLRTDWTEGCTQGKRKQQKHGSTRMSDTTPHNPITHAHTDMYGDIHSSTSIFSQSK
jgi:hypothetical protein